MPDNNRRALIFGIETYLFIHVQTCMCMYVCIYWAYRTCHSVNRNFKMQAKRRKTKKNKHQTQAEKCVFITLRRR